MRYSYCCKGNMCFSKYFKIKEKSRMTNSIPHTGLGLGLEGCGLGLGLALGCVYGLGLGFGLECSGLGLGLALYSVALLTSLDACIAAR